MRVDGATMFEPDLPELVQIGFHVFKANLANFTKSLSSNSVLKAVARKMKEKEAEAQA